MVKIRVSYEQQQELQTVLKLLHPIIKQYKVSKNDKGQYKKAYIDLKE